MSPLGDTFTQLAFKHKINEDGHSPQKTQLFGFISGAEDFVVGQESAKLFPQ